MKFKFILGVDISKDWFNFCLMNEKFEIIWEGEITNNPDDIFRFLTQLLKLTKVKMMDIVVLMEHTGVYVQHLVNCILGKSGRVSLVHAQKVSQLLGGKSKWDEKTDLMDARRLAEYGIRYTDKLKLWKAKEYTLLQLQALQRQRTRLIDVLNALQTPAKESTKFDSKALSEMLATNQKSTIEALKSDIKNIEKKLRQVIQADPVISQLMALIESIPGIGPVTAREVIITTTAFTDFKPNEGKAFARYAGVVPKSNQSGRIKKRDRTGKQGNKNVKKMLTMGATSLIGTQTDLGKYYLRKIEEGKQHFSVINAMRNKLILRIFAVVRNQVIYDRNLNICLE